MDRAGNTRSAEYLSENTVKVPAVNRAMRLAACGNKQNTGSKRMEKRTGKTMKNQKYMKKQPDPHASKHTQNTGHAQSAKSAQNTEHAQSAKSAQNTGHAQSPKSVPHPMSDTRSKGASLSSSVCPYAKKCGGCQYQGMPYDVQLKKKQREVSALLSGFCKVHPIAGMEHPFHYRNKVHAVFDRDRRNNPISGIYREGTHEVIPIDSCLIEDQKADEIILTIRNMLRSFKITVYDEDTGYGLLRHVLVKRGFQTNEIMVVLVTASPVFPSRNNFVKALRQRHPEITTVIQNINGRGTSMVLGDKEHVLYGKGYIEDILCGFRFRISAKSFYQINPAQTEVLYQKAISLAGLTGSETVIDAYCGIGTIGLIASPYAARVIGVELNRDAVRDAVINAKQNHADNVRFYCADAGRFMVDMADAGEKADVVFMDPPRSGSDEAFLSSIVRLAPKKVVYISCNPVTQKRDLEYLCGKGGYRAEGVWPVDMFPGTSHVETVVLLSHKT